MENLPRETALDILSRLSVTSLVQFRSVSRTCHMLSYDPFLVELHLTENNLCLIFHCEVYKNQLYFVELSDKQANKIVRKIQTHLGDVLPEFNVIASCNGLLCLSDLSYGDPLHIYNPLTGKYRELPRSRQFESQNCVSFGFGFHPRTNEYKIIKIVNSYKKMGELSSQQLLHYYVLYSKKRRNDYIQLSEVQVYCLGSATWRSIGRVPYNLRGTSEALVDGRLHWSAPKKPYGQIIVSFDLADEHFREVPTPNCCYDHMAVLRGCLSITAYSGYDSLEIWVMNEYNVKESWTKEYSIGGFSPVSWTSGRNVGGFSPWFWKPEFPRSGVFREKFLGNNRRTARALCLMNNGNLLVEYLNVDLVSYDPESGAIKSLTYQGMPGLFQTFVHVGCLNSVATPMHATRLWE